VESVAARQRWRNAMLFETLDEKIQHDDAVEITRKERIGRWVAIAVISVVGFGVLCFAVYMLG
jgi:hypothetical protein